MQGTLPHIRSAIHKTLRGPEVAELQCLGPAVKQEILWLEVAVSDTHAMDKSEGSGQLVHVEFHVVPATRNTTKSKTHDVYTHHGEA